VAENLRFTIHRWSVESGIPYRDLCEYLKGTKPDGLRGESQAEFFLSTVLAALFRAREQEPSEALDLDQQKARLAKEQADKISMENAIRRGEQVPRDATTRVWAGALTSFRARLLAAPSKLAPQVNPENPNLARDIISAELERILAELADAPLRSGGSDGMELAAGAAVDPPAAAETDGKPVGGPLPNAKRGKQRRAGKVEH
jgi:hypothetical protein